MPTKPKKKVELVEPVDEPDVPETAGADALQAEVADEPQTVEYDGHQYTILVQVDQDIDLIESLAAFAAGNGLHLPGIVETVLGAEQYAQFKDRYRDPETGRTPYKPLRELFNVLDAALGE